MRLLKRKCTFIRPEEYYSASGSLRCPAVLLTFDDGLRNNAEVVAPILRRLDTPAVFFVSSRHCIQGQQLWFTYLNMLRCYYPGTSVTLNGSSICLAGAQRKKGIDELALRLLALEPHPEAAYAAIASQLPRLEEFVPTSILADECYGMTPEQVLAPSSVADTFDRLKEQALIDASGITATGTTAACLEVIDSGRFDCAQVYYKDNVPKQCSTCGAEVAGRAVQA